MVIKGDTIVERAAPQELDQLLMKYGKTFGDVTILKPDQFLMPGLIDTHIHASQFPNAGLALDLTLLDWLQKYTFPTETGLSELSRAEQVYSRCVRATLDSGTTTAAYFATIHSKASLLLASICQRLGQRAWVGKVCMDRNSPDSYREDTEASVAATKQFVSSITELNSDLVRPIITPRFVPSCSRELMSQLGGLAAQHNIAIQTHLSENIPECKWVKELEPDCDNYAEVYNRCGLLTDRTILAHCVHLTDQEVELLASTGAGVSHCPNSNFSLKSGVCDVRRLRQAKVKIGLGTDCSGGFSPSMLNSMRMTVMASNSLTFRDPSYNPLQFSDALYLATRGGAELLQRQDTLGSLDLDKKADILLVDMDAQSNTRLFGGESPEDIVSKFVFLSDDRNIRTVWVDGNIVKS